MGAYCSDTDVELRLRGKVRIVEDVDDDRGMPRALLQRLIAEAEAEVEHDLSPRYAAPFQGYAGEPFTDLSSVAREYVRTLCELKAVVRVLETDFGSGSAADAEKYTKTQAERYSAMLAKQMQIREGTYNAFLYPPLAGLRVALTNVADDGFQGEIINTSALGDRTSYPWKQINDPSASFYNGEIDP